MTNKKYNPTFTTEQLVKAQSEIYQFYAWARKNPDAIEGMLTKAHELAFRRGYVSVHYLFEWLRYDADTTIVLPREQMRRRWKLPNAWTAVFLRVIKREEPSLIPYLHASASIYDAEELMWPPVRGKAA